MKLNSYEKIEKIFKKRITNKKVAAPISGKRLLYIFEI